MKADYIDRPVFFCCNCVQQLIYDFGGYGKHAVNLCQECANRTKQGLRMRCGNDLQSNHNIYSAMQVASITLECVNVSLLAPPKKVRTSFSYLCIQVGTWKKGWGSYYTPDKVDYANLVGFLNGTPIIGPYLAVQLLLSCRIHDVGLITFA